MTSLIAFLDHQPVQEPRPFLLVAAKVDCPPKPPKRPIAAFEIDPMHAMAMGQQRIADRPASALPPDYKR
jgi:hypothetical protein